MLQLLHFVIRVSGRDLVPPALNTFNLAHCAHNGGKDPFRDRSRMVKTQLTFTGVESCV